MKIKTMKDLKEALNKVPDETLQHFGVSMTDEGWEVSTNHSEETNPEIDVTCDDVGMMEYYRKSIDKYPELNSVAEYIRAIISSVTDEDNEGEEWVTN